MSSSYSLSAVMSVNQVRLAGWGGLIWLVGIEVELGTCESAICVPIESQIESRVKIRIRIEYRIESAVGPTIAISILLIQLIIITITHIWHIRTSHKIITSLPLGEWNIYCDERVCLSIHSHISEQHHQTSPNSLPVTYGHDLVLYGDTAKCHVLPVLWMTSYFHIMDQWWHAWA